MAKHVSSQHWLARQHKDIYVKRARKSHYRSRAVYKLIEIDRKDHLLKKGMVAVDLGAAPGSWSQYISERVGESGKVIAVDLLPMEPVRGVDFIQGDFTDASTYQQCIEIAGNLPVDLVFSDMAPNISGIRDTDQTRSIYLAELAFDLAGKILQPGGNMLVKVFQGKGTDSYRQYLKEHFSQVLTRKPEASRDKSREIYILAKGFKL